MILDGSGNAHHDSQFQELLTQLAIQLVENLKRDSLVEKKK